MRMTDPTNQAKDAAMNRLRKADARVRKHEQERQELEEAIQEARRAGWTPSEISGTVLYDRNHVGRLLKKANLTRPRAKADEVHASSSGA